MSRLCFGVLAGLALAAVLAGCGGEKKSGPAKADQSSPKALAESIFAAARSGELGALEGIAAPTDSDGDARDVAGVAKADAAKQESFKSFFAKGKVDGEVKVEGERAEVPILFGPDGTKKETFNMVKVAGLWYLQSF